MGTFIHSSSDVDVSSISEDTTVWQYCVILPGAKIGRSCNICSHCFIEGGVSIGNFVTIKNGVRIFSGVIIEDNVFDGPNVTFTNDRYPRSNRDSMASNFVPETTVVKTGASVGAGAVLLPGLIVGSGAIVAAGAVVTRSILDGEVFNPAR